MDTCRHCENLAAELAATRGVLERLEQVVLAHVEELTETRTLVEGMQKMLLGNGQPGRCAEHGLRIARLERWRSWITGALAAIGMLWVAAIAIVTVLVESMKR
jgi:hypothetical protein